MSKQQRRPFQMHDLIDLIDDLEKGYVRKVIKILSVHCGVRHIRCGYCNKRFRQVRRGTGSPRVFCSGKCRSRAWRGVVV